MGHTTDLDCLKACRDRAIFARSDEIVEEGLLLTGRPEGTVLLPMDECSRLKYHVLNSRSDEISGWPIYLRGMGCLTFVAILGAVDLEQVVTTAFEWNVEVIVSGSVIIQQILACETEEEVDAIVDNRKWSDFNNSGS